MTYIPKPLPPKSRVVTESGRDISNNEIKDDSDVDWVLVVNSIMIICLVIGLFLTLVVRLINVL